MRYLDLAVLGQYPKAILLDRSLDRRALLPPVRNQLVDRNRIDHRARQDMRADLRSLLDDADRDFVALLGRKLLQSDRGRQPGRPATDDHDVVFHALAIAGLVHFPESLLRFLRVRHKRSGMKYEGRPPWLG